MRLKLNSKVQQPRFHLPAGEIAEIAPSPLFGNPPQALITQASARMTTHRSPTLNQFDRREFATPLLATHKPSTTQAIGQKAGPMLRLDKFPQIATKTAGFSTKPAVKIFTWLLQASKQPQPLRRRLSLTQFRSKSPWLRTPLVTSSKQPAFIADFASSPASSISKIRAEI
ncbi:MAG: hypothetical protein ACK5R1_13280 [Planctomycetota bacterium]